MAVYAANFKTFETLLIELKSRAFEDLAEAVATNRLSSLEALCVVRDARVDRLQN